MRLLIIAPPGGGKGTQATRLAEHFDIEHISSGDLLRQEIKAQTELGQRVQAYVEQGDLVPDTVIVELLRDRVVAAAKAGGYILDGFPRNREQAEIAFHWASKFQITIHAAVNLDVPVDEVLRRLRGRAATEGRRDDNEQTIRHRIDVYLAATEPMLDYYDERGVLITIDGAQAPDDVTASILAALPVVD